MEEGNKKVTINKETLNLINELGIINSQVILQKDAKDECVVISRTNASKSIAYIFSTPKVNFDFDGSEIAFYNLPDFYQMFSCFNDPSVSQNGNKLFITKNTSKINYLLSDADVIERGPGNVDFKDADVKYLFTIDDLKEIQKMIGLIRAEHIEFSIVDTNLTVKVFNKGHENSFEKVYTAENNTKASFKLKIKSEIFNVIPKENYTLELKKEGIIRLSFNKEIASLQLFVAEAE